MIKLKFMFEKEFSRHIGLNLWWAEDDFYTDIDIDHYFCAPLAFYIDLNIIYAVRLEIYLGKMKIRNINDPIESFLRR